MYSIRRIIQTLLCLLVFAANSALALAYPYANSFDTAGERAEWTLGVGGDWGLSTSDHNNWTAESSAGFLDNNPAEVNQSNRNTSQEATLTDYVTIPISANQPTLTYRYKSILIDGSWVYIEVQTQGSSSWTTLDTYSIQHNQTNYTSAEFDLSGYKGQNIRIRFRQQFTSQSGARLFVVDDLSIADLSIESFAYPYTNNFDTAGEQDDWNVEGDWGRSTSDHNNWTANSPSGFLDNNPSEKDQFNHQTGHEVTMTGSVLIPMTARQPTLTYRYKSDLVSLGNEVYLELQTPGSSNWTTLFTYSTQHDQANYTTAEIDLSTYIGQSIRLRFRQYNNYERGARLFVVDDLSIADFSIESYSYPYTNNFDSIDKQDDWNTEGDWDVSTTDHNNWTAESPSGYLDNNHNEVDQRHHTTEQVATLNGYVSIPNSASNPTLSYRYKSDLSIDGEIHVEIQTQGTTSWTTIFTYNNQYDRGRFITAELDLTAYKGENIRLRFRQYYSWQNGARMFVIDDLSIADLSIKTFSYPYTNNFDSGEQLDEWNTEGDWDISTTDHNNWTANSPAGYLDNNRNEIEQRNHTTGHVATLNGYVSIPVTATQPSLLYQYKSDLSVDGEIFVEVQTQGSASWTTLTTHTSSQDQSTYTASQNDLSAYKGQSIRIRFRQSYSWHYGLRVFTVDDFCINDLAGECVFSVQPVAEWHFDELSWLGVANEVIESSGNGNHGQAINGALTKTGKVCRAGDFDGSNYVQIVNDPLLEVGKNNADFSVSFWLNLEQGATGAWRSIIHKGNGSSERTFAFWMWPTDNRIFYRISTTSSLSEGGNTVNTVPLNTWTHIAVIKKGNTYSIYLDGVLDSSVILAGGSISNTGPLYIGKDSVFAGIDGQIDEVRVYDVALDETNIQEIMGETRTCEVSGPDHFLISHDGAGIHCAAETIQVSVLDNSSQVLTGYTGTITLDTQTGTGNWTGTTGSGVLTDATADDGLAVYTFDASDNGVAGFTLDYTSGISTFNIDVYEGAIRDDDSEGNISFAPSGFILTNSAISNPPPGVINDPIANQVAGSDFNVHVTAFGTTATDPTCGIIESYTGTKTIDFLGNYTNPASGSQSLTINNNVIAMTGASTGQSISFSNGQAQLLANYKDAGQISFNIEDNSGTSLISGSTNDFVVKPANFAFQTIERASDNFANPGAVNENGTIFAGAGADLNLTVAAVNSLGQVTPNYGNETTPESIKILHSLVAPASGVSGSLSGALTPQGNGIFSGTFNWNEVGIIDLAASVTDSDYLSAGDINTNSGNVGRFIPHHFQVSNKLSGALDVGCPSGGGFNYIGQQFGYGAGNQPEFQIEAKNLTGTTTLNYSGSYAKLGIAGVSIPQVIQDSSNSMAITHQQAVASFSSVSNGIFKYTFGSDQFTYDRSNSTTGIFDSDIDIIIDSIADSDGVTDNFSTAELLEPTTVNMRYGRLMIDSAFGSELVDLVLPIKVQFYDGAIGDFVTHADDTCSSFSVLPLEMLDTLNPTSLTTTLSSLMAGEGSLTISSPGAGNTGSLGITLDAPTWLEFDWGRPVGESNRLEPKATASFGIYSGNDAFIYRREIR